MTNPQLIPTLYGAWVNLGGLGTDTPVKLRLEIDEMYQDAPPTWWVDEGPSKDNFEFPFGAGLHVSQGGDLVRFAASSKDEVQAFINGARAVATTLFSGVPPLTANSIELEAQREKQRAV